ncbi:hypothetical protein LguiA_022108 [Lonicera macranthoides]
MNNQTSWHPKMQGRKGSFRVFDHRNQVFRIEHKVFLLNIEDNGSMVSIKEMNRQRTYTIRIDFGGVYWLLEGLKSAAHRFKDKVFFSKYLASYAMFTMEKYSNKNGSFIRLLEIRKGTVTNIVIFPAGSKGNGWFGLVESLHNLLYSPSSSNIADNYKVKCMANERQKAVLKRKVEGQISYADAVRKSSVNNIGEEEVVLEHSTHMDETMAQDKIITATPTKLISDGKTQEKAEDKIDADNLEYESSSFADDVSSTGTVVEDSQEELSRDLLHGHLKPEEQSEKAIMEVIQGHARVNAIWPVFGNHGGTSQDHSHLSLKEITTRDSETANKSHEEGEVDAVSHRGEEDWIRVDPKSKGRNRRRMSNLTKFKWVQRPNQVYSKRKMKDKVTLKAGEEIEGTSNGKVMENWKGELLGSTSQSNVVRDGMNLESVWGEYNINSSDEANLQFEDDDLECDEEGTLYNESFDGEKLEDHASFKHFEENGKSLMSLFNVGNTGNSISNYIARRDEQSSSWWSQVSYDQVRGCIFKLGNLFSVLTGDIRVNRRLSKLSMIMFYNSEMMIKTGISLTSMVENNDVWVAKSKSRVVTLQSTAIQRVLPVISYEFFEVDYRGSGACLSTVCKVSAANDELTEADKGGSEAVSSSDRLESEGNDTPSKVLIRDKHFSKSGNSQSVVCRESGNNKDWGPEQATTTQRIGMKEARLFAKEHVVKKSTESSRNQKQKEEATYANIVQRGSSNDTRALKEEKINFASWLLDQQQWNRVVICTRDSLWEDWKKVKETLNGYFRRNFELKPFQPDKAVFWCKDEAEAILVAEKNIPCIEDSPMIKLQYGSKTNVAVNRKLCCTGGWIEIFDLPLKWWRMEVFKAIRWECGGLEEMHSRTLSLEQCFSARIKVGGKASGFIPAEIDLRMGSETCTVKLKVLTNLNFSKKNHYRFPTYIGDFNRCSVVVVAKNCGDEGETPKICTGNNNRDKFTGENEEDECATDLSENLKIVVESPITVENRANSLGTLEGAATGSKKFGLKCSPNRLNTSREQGVGFGIAKKRAKPPFKNGLKVKGLKISKWSSNNGFGLTSFKRKLKKSNMFVDEGDKEINFDLKGDESSDNNSPKQYFHPTEILYAELKEYENEDAVEFDSVGDWGGDLVSRLDEQEDLSSEDSGLGEEENKMIQNFEMDDTCLPLLFHNDEAGEALQ